MLRSPFTSLPKEPPAPESSPQLLALPHFHADLTHLAVIAHEGFGHKHGGAKKHITKAKPSAPRPGQQPAHHPRAPRPSVGTPGHSAPGGRAETPGWDTCCPAGHEQSPQAFHRSRSRGDQGRTESRRVRSRGAPAGPCP